MTSQTCTDGLPDPAQGNNPPFACLHPCCATGNQHPKASLQETVPASPHCQPAEGTPSALLCHPRATCGSLLAAQRHWWAAHRETDSPQLRATGSGVIALVLSEVGRLCITSTQGPEPLMPVSLAVLEKDSKTFLSGTTATEL